MEQYNYLLINFFTVIICFLFSFHPRIRFDRHFIAFIKASSLVAVPFIVWDAWFTAIGVWWFNERYLTGYGIAGLPIEEILFFFCIPFSCIFTYFCLDKFLNFSFRPRLVKNVVSIAATLFIVVAALHTDRIYTTVTLFSTALLLLVLQFIVRVDWLGKAIVVYAILLLPFFIVNGLLTGTGLEQPVVNYNSEDFLNIRLLTIPVEDVVYGFEMFVLNLYFFKRFSTEAVIS